MFPDQNDWIHLKHLTCSYLFEELSYCEFSTLKVKCIMWGGRQGGGSPGERLREVGEERAGGRRPR